MGNNAEPLSEDGVAETMPWESLRRVINGYDASEWLDLEKTLWFVYTVALTEFRTTWRGEGWRVMIKGLKHGDPVVAYVHCLHYQDTLEFALWMMKEGELSFAPDKYPVKF